MTKTVEIIVVGSHAPGLFMRVERIPLAGETVIGWDFHEPVDGGKGSNQAIAAARLGARVAFVGCVGRDRLGDEAEDWMRQAGVYTDYLFRSDSTGTGAGFIILSVDGVPLMVTSMGANAELTEKHVADALTNIDNGKVLLTQFEIQPKVALYAVRTGHEKGMLTIVNPAPAAEVPVSEFKYCDILVPNETEAMEMLGIDTRSSNRTPIELASELRRHYQVPCVMVTIGELGVAVADENGCVQIHPPVVKAVDTSGAGDAFCAALAVGLAEGRSLRGSADWACQVATLSVTRPGTILAYPTLAEVDDFILHPRG